MSGEAVALHLDQASTWAASHYYGVYPATVTDNQDPSSQGRVKVRLPWTPDAGSDAYEVWARLATTMAGGNRGTWFIPEVGDEVLVSFQAGDPQWPYVLGALWNGQDDPPESIDADNDIRSITSRSGIKITLDDTSGAVTLTLETPGGQKATFADAGSSVELSDANGNSIKMDPSGMTITAASQLTVDAPTATFNVGQVTANSAIWTYSGVIQCDVMIASSVVGATYTPGVGNFL